MSSHQNTGKINKEDVAVLGIDIGSAYLRACVTSGKNILDTFEVVSNGVQNGYVTEAVIFEEDVMQLLLKVTSGLGFMPKKIVIGISTRMQNSVSASANIITGRSDGLILENDIDECVKKAKAKIDINKNCDVIHTLIIKKVIDDNVIYGDIAGLKGHKIDLKILFIYEDKKNQKIIYDVFEKLGIGLDQVVSGPFAESLVALNKKDMRLGTCSINIGLSNTSLVVYENNYPMLCSVISGGGENITSDLSLGLRMSYAEAEEIKRGISKSETGKRRVEEIIEARTNYLNNKINEELKRVKRSELLPGGLVISGGTSGLSKIDQYMRYDLKIPTSLSNKKIEDYPNLNLKSFLNSENIRSYGIAMLYDKSYESSIYFEYVNKIYKAIYCKIKKYLP